MLLDVPVGFVQGLPDAVEVWVYAAGAARCLPIFLNAKEQAASRRNAQRDATGFHSVPSATVAGSPCCSIHLRSSTRAPRSVFAIE